MRKILSYLIALGGFCLALGSAHAQNMMSLDLDISSPLEPVLTWTTTPEAQSCVASGDWAGTKSGSGSETLGAIRASHTWSMTCSWAGVNLHTLVWENPTLNTDGSPYDDPMSTRLVWSQDGVTDFDCLDPNASGDNWTDRPPDQTMHTITSLNPGDWSFAAFAVNSMSLCSEISNVVSRMFAGSVSMSDSISVTVPEAPRGLSVD